MWWIRIWKALAGAACAVIIAATAVLLWQARLAPICASSINGTDLCHVNTSPHE